VWSDLLRELLDVRIEVHLFPTRDATSVYGRPKTVRAVLSPQMNILSTPAQRYACDAAISQQFGYGPVMTRSSTSPALHSMMRTSSSVKRLRWKATGQLRFALTRTATASIRLMMRKVTDNHKLTETSVHGKSITGTFEMSTDQR
jgi:hypothetical protein